MKATFITVPSLICDKCGYRLLYGREDWHPGKVWHGISGCDLDGAVFNCPKIELEGEYTLTATVTGN